MLAERKALAVEGSDGEPIRRKSAIVEAARIVASLTSHGVRTLCFAKTRKLQELVLGYARGLDDGRLPPDGLAVSTFHGQRLALREHHRRADLLLALQSLVLVVVLRACAGRLSRPRPRRRGDHVMRGASRP